MILDICIAEILNAEQVDFTMMKPPPQVAAGMLGRPDHTMDADVVFVVEATALNGAYLPEMLDNYIKPTLE